ncbi:MAG: hypothetical protein K1060chlam5_01238 [Candidatus Anoxychlamydiales bacterium]|nr:hypothetical protein [Candidatus Anoxychlamydiales bacterium]
MKKLYRSNNNKKFLGVCSGIGNYFSIDPTIIRLFFIFIAILTAIIPMVIVYGVAALIIPIEPRSNIAKKYPKLYRSPTKKVIAGVLGGIASYFDIDANIIRLIFIVLFFITAVAPLFIGYIIAWIIIPIKPYKNNYIE